MNKILSHEFLKVEIMVFYFEHQKFEININKVIKN